MPADKRPPKPGFFDSTVIETPDDVEFDDLPEETTTSTETKSEAPIADVVPVIKPVKGSEAKSKTPMINVAPANKYLNDAEKPAESEFESQKKRKSKKSEGPKSSRKVPKDERTHMSAAKKTARRDDKATGNAIYARGFIDNKDRQTNFTDYAVARTSDELYKYHVKQANYLKDKIYDTELINGNLVVNMQRVRSYSDCIELYSQWDGSELDSIEATHAKVKRGRGDVISFLTTIYLKSGVYGGEIREKEWHYQKVDCGDKLNQLNSMMGEELAEHDEVGYCLLNSAWYQLSRQRNWDNYTVNVNGADVSMKTLFQSALVRCKEEISGQKLSVTTFMKHMGAYFSINVYAKYNRNYANLYNIISNQTPFFINIYGEEGHAVALMSRENKTNSAYSIGKIKQNRFGFGLMKAVLKPVGFAAEELKYGSITPADYKTYADNPRKRARRPPLSAQDVVKQNEKYKDLVLSKMETADLDRDSLDSIITAMGNNTIYSALCNDCDQEPHPDLNYLFTGPKALKQADLKLMSILEIADLVLTNIVPFSPNDTARLQQIIPRWLTHVGAISPDGSFDISVALTEFSKARFDCFQEIRTGLHFKAFEDYIEQRKANIADVMYEDPVFSTTATLNCVYNSAIILYEIATTCTKKPNGKIKIKKSEPPPPEVTEADSRTKADKITADWLSLMGDWCMYTRTVGGKDRDYDLKDLTLARKLSKLKLYNYSWAMEDVGALRIRKIDYVGNAADLNVRHPLVNVTNTPYSPEYLFEVEYQTITGTYYDIRQVFCADNFVPYAPPVTHKCIVSLDLADKLITNRFVMTITPDEVKAMFKRINNLHPGHINLDSPEQIYLTKWFAMAKNQVSLNRSVTPAAFF